jgi:hypothetical protein
LSISENRSDALSQTDSGYLLFAEAHHSIDYARAEHQATREDASQTRTENHWNHGNSTSKEIVKASSLKALERKYLHAINSCSIPQRPLLNLASECLDMIDEHAAERSLNGQDEEADADLDDAGHEAEHLSKQNAQAIPEAEQNADWKKKTMYTHINSWRKSCHVQNAPTIPSNRLPYLKYQGIPSST